MSDQSDAELIAHLRRYAANVPSVAKLWRVPEAADRLEALSSQHGKAMEALAGIEDRFRYAATMYHDATRWASEDSPDSEISLLDYVFAEVRTVLQSQKRKDLTNE